IHSNEVDDLAAEQPSTLRREFRLQQRTIDAFSTMVQKFMKCPFCGCLMCPSEICFDCQRTLPSNTPQVPKNGGNGGAGGSGGTGGSGSTGGAGGTGGTGGQPGGGNGTQDLSEKVKEG
ncbi:Hypothetical predicted protein, partial [Cloeon dipterum]